MQLNMEVAIGTQIHYFESYTELIDKQYHIMKEYAQLERAVGKNLELFNDQSVSVQNPIKGDELCCTKI